MKGDPLDIQHDRDAMKPKTINEEMTKTNTKEVPQLTQSTFKENLIDNKPKVKEIKLGKFKEIDLDDNSVIIDNSGSIPSLRFSNRIHNDTKDSIKQTAVIRLLASGLRCKGLESVIKAIWKPKGDYTIMDLENNFYIV